MRTIPGTWPAGRLWLATMLLLLAVLETASAQPRRILMLHSYGPHFAPWSAVASRFREELLKQSPYPVDLYEVSLQAGRTQEPPDEGPFVEYLSALFAESGLDLVVVFGTPAAQFYLKHRSEIFPSTPLLITGAEARTLSGSALGANDTVVPVVFDHAKLIENALTLLPDTTTIAIVIGDSPLERFWVTEQRRAYQRFAGRVRFEWLNELSVDEMVQRVSSLPQRSAIYYGFVRVDAQGVPQMGDRVLVRLREAAKAPIFGYLDASLGQGIVGGPLISSEQIAWQTAAVAVRILRGESPGEIRTPAIGQTTAIYDWRELQRWNISEALLPAGSIVRFRELAVWEKYRWELLAVLALVLTQAAMIAWLLIEHRRRRRAELLVRGTMTKLIQMNRLATAGELSASIAHEVKQPLAGITARANAALRWLAGDQPNIGKAREALGYIVDAGHRAGDIVTSVRAMFQNEPSERAPVAINRLIRTVLEIARPELQKYGVELQVQLGANLPAIRCDQVQLQQVLLNLVVNAIEAMHETEPRVLRVRSELRDGVVRVSVEDTGTGIDPENDKLIFRPMFTTKPTGMGVGLSICQSIIESHEGRIWVSPAAGRGAVFQFELPACST